MSQIRIRQTSGLLILTALLFLAGCGSSVTSPASMDPAREGHPAGWLPAGHMVAARADSSVCTSCHGIDYSGGIAQVSCTQCHIGNALNIHPLAWGDQILSQHGGYVKANGNIRCSNIYCHGADLTGVAGSGPSCTSCHIGGVGSFHPADWGDKILSKHGGYVKINGNTGCANAACHGPELTGVAGSGPSCTSCHIGGVGSFHPADWGDLAYARHPSYVLSNGTTACSNAACHGPELTGVADSGPSCTSCHIGGPLSFHPAAWATDFLQHAPYVAANGTGSCSNVVCHGVSLQGVYLSGPACTICHTFPFPLPQ
jgi:hypothetical protein